MKGNIITLLTNNFAESSEIPPIPSEEEAVKLLSLQQNQPPINELPDVPEQHDFEPKIKESCIVIWDEQDGRKWFVLCVESEWTHSTFSWSIWSKFGQLKQKDAGSTHQNQRNK